MKTTKLLIDELNEGMSKFGLDVGIISNVNQDLYKVIVCVSHGPDINVGDEYELSNTYCSDVIKDRKTKYYKDVANITEMLKHPCYLNTQLRAYIGTPLIVNEVLWGTINYSSLFPRKIIYSEAEVRYLEEQAKLVSDILDQQLD